MRDVLCTSGPNDRPFEEQHGSMCIALVTEGTFVYRTAQGRAVMAPDSLLLGNAGDCFECGHEHSTGDRCLSFQFSPEFLEAVAASVPGVRQLGFQAPRLPPLPTLLPLVATAQVMRDEAGDDSGFHELTLRLAGAVCSIVNSPERARRAPTGRDERRIALALHRIEAEPQERLSLDELAAEAAASSYHFLRVFEQVVGITPGQYVLRTRLRRAAVRLRSSDESIAAIALDCGFRDLSTFNHHFRRMMLVTPSVFRARA